MSAEDNMADRMAWLLVACATLTGCDTVGELTFQEEQILEIAPEGIVASHCGVEGDDGVLKLSVLTSFNERLTPGKRMAALGDILEPGRNFSASNVSISDGWFFVVDEKGDDKSCDTDADCMSGAQCATPAEMGLVGYYYAPGRVCAIPSQIVITRDPAFEHYGRLVMEDNALVTSRQADGRTFAFMLDNSSTLDGSEKTGIPDNSLATDPWQYRKVALNQFMDGLSLTSETGSKCEFSAIFANGNGESGVYDISQAWIRTMAQWESRVMSNYPSPSGNSPIWEASSATIDKVQDSGNALYRKYIVALTDGAPNYGTEEAMISFSRKMTSGVGAGVDLYWLDYEPGDGSPQRAYAEMTGIGCGAYYLFESASQAPEIMRNIAINSESHWNVGVKFSAKLPEGYMYRLATTIVVKVGDSAVAYEAQRVSEQNETIDRRLAVLR